MFVIPPTEHHAGDPEPTDLANGAVVWRLGGNTGWILASPRAPVLAAKDYPHYLDALYLCDTQAHMRRLVMELRTGRYVIEISRTTTQYRLIAVTGVPVSDWRDIESTAWLYWLQANAEAFVPEFAAAMRAWASMQRFSGAPRLSLVSA